MLEVLKDKLDEAKKLFHSENIYKSIVIENIDCSILLDAKEVDGKNLPKNILESIFYKLHCFDSSEIEINKCPVIYIFELKDENDYDRVIESYKNIRSKNIDRKLPVLKTKIPKSKYIYIGKVEKGIGGRIVTHLGYYKSSGNHGLQLAFWANKLNPPLKINIHILRFKEEFRPFISAFEVIMAKELKPFIGKH